MSFIFKSIDHIQLAAPKGAKEAARKFFVDILGFNEVEKPEELKKRGGAFSSGSDNPVISITAYCVLNVS